MDAFDQPTVAILDWLAAIGAGSPGEVAAASGLSLRATSARLRVLEDAGLTRSCRLLHGAPALYALTHRGLRAAGRRELDPVAISTSGFAHLLAVARVAVALAHAGHRVAGERDLRAAERAVGGPLASAEVGLARDGTIALHRPDLVCWSEGPPIAIEVELTVKAPARLRTIVRGWARSRLVGGVVYYATPHAARALAGALRSECASEHVAVLALERAGRLPEFRSPSSIPSAP
jgi:DNA-binding transcriptional ArsR family regulator